MSALPEHVQYHTSFCQWMRRHHPDHLSVAQQMSSDLFASQFPLEQQQVTVYASSPSGGIARYEGVLISVDSSQGKVTQVEILKRESRTRTSTFQSYYDPTILVVAGWGHPMPPEAFHPAADPTAPASIRRGKYGSGNAQQALGDLLAVTGELPWLCWCLPLGVSEEVLWPEVADVPAPESTTVRVEVNSERTAVLRRESRDSEAFVGKFVSPITLYRVMDGEEVLRVLASRVISGGDYSVTAERAYGASWGASQEDVVTFGRYEQKPKAITRNKLFQRLGAALFVARISGEGRWFSHLSPKVLLKGQEDPATGIVDISKNELCNTSLGCSCRVPLSEVLQWSSVDADTGELTPVDLSTLEVQARQSVQVKRDQLIYGVVVLAGVNQRTLAKQINLSMSPTETRSVMAPKMFSAQLTQLTPDYWYASAAEAISSRRDLTDMMNRGLTVVLVQAHAHCRTPDVQGTAAWDLDGVTTTGVWSFPDPRDLSRWHRLRL